MNKLKYKSYSSIKPSFAEVQIIQQLKDRNIFYVREVYFYGCTNPKTGCELRFDFYIPNKNLIIEYDGKDFHEDNDVQYRDSVKNKFAKLNKIKVVRIEGIQNITKVLNQYFNSKSKPKFKSKNTKAQSYGLSNNQKKRLTELLQLQKDSPLEFYDMLMDIRKTEKRVYAELKRQFP